MRKSYRIKREKDFSTIFKQGQNVANRKFVLYRLDKEQAHFRVGLSVSKKLGNAVVRNRVKRLMRHVLINHRQQIKAEDFVLIARKGVEELNYHEVEKNLLHILRLANLYQEGRDCETND